MLDGFTTTDATAPMPSLALLRNRRPPPALPLALLGTVWPARIEAAAEGKNAPADYVLLGLLATASACIGNSRWASPWPSWREPPFLWFGAVGNPSSGKSPGLDAALRDVLPELELTLAADYPERLRAWEGLNAEALAIRDVWEKEVKAAVKRDVPAPRMPEAAIPPPKPVRPRIVTNDPTIEAVAEILSGIPRGLLLHRDELAAFIGSFDKYSGGKGGADRASWLEAWNAAPKTIDRKQRPDPIFVPRFGLSIVGSIQPDRLDDIFSGPDDGLAVRFLWTFPTPRPFARPSRLHDAGQWLNDLGRLLKLPMVKGDDGNDRPWFMRFTNAAADVVLDAGREWSAREAGAEGLMLGALGKARGQMVRLALVLELLRWCAERPGEEAPAEIGEASALAAAAIMDGYFLPMAERVFGAGAMTEAERHGRTLLRHILATGAATVNERVIRETPGLRGLSSADAVRDAVAVLRREDVLLAAPAATGAGRPRADHLVNPRLMEAQAIWQAKQDAAR